MYLPRFLPVISLVCLASSGLLAYESPDYVEAERIFESAHDREALSATTLGESLIEMAVNLQHQNHAVQRRALVLAWLVGNEEVHEKVIPADFYLRLGRTPERSSFMAGNPSTTRARAAAENCLQIISSPELKSDQKGYRVSGERSSRVDDCQCLTGPWNRIHR